MGKDRGKGTFSQGFTSLNNQNYYELISFVGGGIVFNFSIFCKVLSS